MKSALEGAAAAAAPSAGASIKSSTDTAFTLFYGKFRAQAPRVTKVLAAVEKRTEQARGKEKGGELSDWKYFEVDMRVTKVLAAVQKRTEHSEQARGKEKGGE